PRRASPGEKRGNAGIRRGRLDGGGQRHVESEFDDGRSLSHGHAIRTTEMLTARALRAQRPQVFRNYIPVQIGGVALSICSVVPQQVGFKPPLQPPFTNSICSPHTLTSGTLGTEPRGLGGPLSPFGGLRRDDPDARFGLTFAGISGFGVIGPSGNSKPSFSAPLSSLTRTTRTWPPALSLPKSTSSASGFLSASWIWRAIGRALMCSS